MNSFNDKLEWARAEVELLRHHMHDLPNYDRSALDQFMLSITLTYAVLASGLRDASLEMLDAQDEGNPLLLKAARRKHELILIDMKYCHELTKILAARTRAMPRERKDLEE